MYHCFICIKKAAALLASIMSRGRINWESKFIQTTLVGYSKHLFLNLNYEKKLLTTESFLRLWYSTIKHFTILPRAGAYNTTNFTCLQTFYSLKNIRVSVSLWSGISERFWRMLTKATNNSICPKWRGNTLTKANPFVLIIGKIMVSLPILVRKLSPSSIVIFCNTWHGCLICKILR